MSKRDFGSIKSLLHFDYPETLTYEGNAELSNAAKFGKACAHFRDSNSYVSLTNTTGVFNLSANGSAEAECFVKAMKAGGINTDIIMAEGLFANGYYMYDDHVFKFYNNAITWAEAQAACEALGGHLATAPTAAKNTFLMGIANNTPICLGGIYDVEKGLGQWITGEEWNYTIWPYGRPPDATPTGSNTSPIILYTPGAYWMLSTGGQYICEWDSLDSAIPNILNDYGYKFYNGHMFKYYSDTKTWANAKDACEALGGHLATSTSAEKNTFLTTLTTDTAWLGGTDEAEEGVWQWVTDEEWNYTNWHSSQPDNSNNEDYLELRTDGEWNDNNSSSPHGYICEWDSLDSVIPSFLKDNGYKFYNGHTFKVLSTEYDLWDDAKAACEALGGHLATITSAEKQSFIETITANVSVNCWLGGQKDNEGWGWITGETWSYTNWYTGYPANIGDYLKLFTNSGKKWVDDDGIDTRSLAICEWDYDMRESGSSGVSSGNILSLSDNSNVVSTSDAETQGYKFYNGHTFKYYSDTKTWANAKDACEALGGHLATAPTAAKNTFLTTVTSNIIWLGAISENADDNWIWLDGSEWSYTNWASGEPHNTTEYEPYLMMNFSETGKWYDERTTGTRGYICEWDYDIREPKQLTLSIGNDGTLNLKSAIWALDETSTLTLEPDTWYHVLLRLSEGTASVYLDGAQALSGNVSGEDITPQSLTLGGYVGYMDEFVFRDGAGTGSPTIPTAPYEASSGTIAVHTSNNAPVTRAVWTCEDLPEGLTLSSSGVLSGHPTTAGTYDCNVSVATNWGTATKKIRIVVNNV